MNAVEFGRGNGQKILLIPGNMMCWRQFEDVIPLLEREYHVIAVSTDGYIRFFPETRDCASWNDYSFNKRNQMIRLAAFPFLCALMAWIALLLGR